MVKSLILCVVLIGLAVGMPETSGPYPAKGWKPQGARLELPSRNYGPPRTEPTSVIEITTLTNDYDDSQSGDSNDDALRVQALPAVDAVSQFKSFQRQRLSPTKTRQPTAAQIQMPPAPAFGGKPFLLSSLFAPQFASANEQLQERQFSQRQQQLPSVQHQQVPDYSNPKSDAQPFPAQTYGPPKTNNDEPEVKLNEPEVQSNDEQTEDDDDQDSSDDSTIAVAHAESSGNLVEATQQGQVGQYYILLPDNSLQKVRFATKQTEDDLQFNGFSAQLR
jgi:hypothetical protein